MTLRRQRCFKILFIGLTALQQMKITYMDLVIGNIMMNALREAPSIVLGLVWQDWDD
jgi:hypothetical protein